MFQPVPQTRPDVAANEHSFAEASPDAIAIYCDDQIVYVNPAGLKLLGAASKEQVLGKSAGDFVPPEVRDDALACLKRALASASTPPVEDRLVRLDGETVYSDISATRIVHNGKPALLLLGRDVTERKVTELSQRDGEERLRLLAGHAQGLIFRYQSETTARKQTEKALRYYARRLETLHRIDEAVLAAKSPEQVAMVALQQISMLVPTRHAIVVRLNSSLREGRVIAAVKDGAPAYCPSALCWPADYGDLAERVLSGETIVLDETCSLPPGSPIASLLADHTGGSIVVPLVAEGSLVGTLNLSLDTDPPLHAEHAEIVREVADQLAMTIRQSELRDALHAYAGELESRVTARTAELQAANESLEAAAARLRELDELKTQFVSNVSHELRTPLTNIKLYLELLEDGRQSKRPQYMATLRREVDLLHMVIEDLLTLTRFDADRADPLFEPIDLNQLVAVLLQDRAHLAAIAGVTLELQSYPRAPIIRADHKMITQVMTNLLSNAVNYTPEGGCITVSTGTEARDGRLWASVSVTDTGPGISDADREHLFDRFYRGQAALNGKRPGTGLGLSICKEIVDRHGGEIIVESGAGNGSSFTVYLPAA